MIQNGKHLNKFLSDIDMLMSPLTEVIKILITSCHKLNIAINSISYDTIIKYDNAVFLFLKQQRQNQDHETKAKVSK